MRNEYYHRKSDGETDSLKKFSFVEKHVWKNDSQGNFFIHSVESHHILYVRAGMLSITNRDSVGEGQSLVREYSFVTNAKYEKGMIC